MTPGQTGPFPPNQGDPKMSDPSHIQHSSSSTPIESAEDDAAEPRSTPLLQALILGLFKLVGVGLVVYLTYFFTTMFAHRTPPPAPLSQEQIALAKKAEDLRAQGKKVLSSYGWVDPVTKSKLRIPIDRAMELYLAESNRPPAPPAAVPGPTATPAAPAAGPGTGATAVATTPAATTAPVATTAPAGMPPEQMYRLVCMACHDTDGKGKIVRLAMPSIPDLTDPKWQASRTDAELLHSILEGKESTVNGVRIPLMLPMKDKLALAHTEVKDMVAFMRAFKGGKQVVSATPGGMPAPGVPGPVAGGPTQGVPPTPAPPPSPPTNIGTERLAGSPPPQQPAPVSTPPIARAPRRSRRCPPRQRALAPRYPLHSLQRPRSTRRRRPRRSGRRERPSILSASPAMDRTGEEPRFGPPCHYSPTSPRTTGIPPRATVSSPRLSWKAKD